MNHVCAIQCQNWVSINYCLDLNEVFNFAKDLRGSANFVCGCVNCVHCFDKMFSKSCLSNLKKTVPLM